MSTEQERLSNITSIYSLDHPCMHPRLPCSLSILYSPHTIILLHQQYHNKNSSSKSRSATIDIRTITLPYNWLLPLLAIQFNHRTKHAPCFPLSRSLSVCGRVEWRREHGCTVLQAGGEYIPYRSITMLITLSLPRPSSK